MVGRLLSEAHLAAASAVCASRGMWLLAHHSHLTLATPPHSRPSLQDMHTYAASSARYSSLLSIATQATHTRTEATEPLAQNAERGARLRSQKIIVVGDYSYALGVGGWGVAHAVVGGGVASEVDALLAAFSPHALVPKGLIHSLRPHTLVA